MHSRLRQILALSTIWIGSWSACGPRAEPEAPTACVPVQELLANGDFEAGGLQGWRALSGTGSVVTDAQDGFARARRGSAAFSSSAKDGATKDRKGHEVVLSQAIPASSGRLSAGTPIAGSMFVRGDESAVPNGEALLVVQFMRGGENGEIIDQTNSEYTDPSGAGWQQVTTPPKRIPHGTDTIVYAYRSAVGLGQDSIELVADDLSLAVCGTGGLGLASWSPVRDSSGSPNTDRTAVAATPASAPARPEGVPTPLVDAYVTRIAVNDFRSWYIDPSGKLWTWGYGGASAPSAGPFIELAANDGRVCGLRADHTVDCFGHTALAPSVRDAAQISIAGGHAGLCTISTSGSVGCGRHNPLSKGSYLDIVQPEPNNYMVVTSDHKVIGTAYPPVHDAIMVTSTSCALLKDGSIACRGTKDKDSPRKPALASWLFRGREDSTCALLASGGLQCFGGMREELANVQQLKSPDAKIRDVSFSKVHACAIVEAGAGERVQCWGLRGAPATMPPAEIGEYIGTLAYPVGPRIFGDSEHLVPLPDDEFAPGADCKAIELSSLPASSHDRKVFENILHNASQSGGDRVFVGDPYGSGGPTTRPKPTIRRCSNWLEMTLTQLPTSWTAFTEPRVDYRYRILSKQARAELDKTFVGLPDEEDVGSPGAAGVSAPRVTAKSWMSKYDDHIVLDARPGKPGNRDWKTDTVADMPRAMGTFVSGTFVKEIRVTPWGNVAKWD